ncbi:ABC transporter ATP-binding protein [Arthrobacter sp. AK04]|uniref:ATP-binding cassette domain-containing protein n=1 Tax=Arthrobacter sp. AK04 TaxID=2900048 RepID=UPI001E290B5F|nr:ABC transporter ATP-binding protein [Arthrobacter sp. AK04]MCD5342812.1 ABC transporter ATP-binding protein [Arthrobacter sp. AK04]
MTHADDLRAWARGMYTTEAATELLLKAFGGKFAAPGNPWVHTSTEPEGPGKVRAWIDFAAIPEEVGPLSGGERRFLMLAASLAEDVPVVLGDLVSGLDRENLDLVLAAIAHAGGSHQHSDIRFNDDGSLSMVKGYLDSLHPWPRTLRAV